MKYHKKTSYERYMQEMLYALRYVSLAVAFTRSSGDENGLFSESEANSLFTISITRQKIGEDVADYIYKRVSNAILTDISKLKNDYWDMAEMFVRKYLGWVKKYQLDPYSCQMELIKQISYAKITHMSRYEKHKMQALEYLDRIAKGE